jgi:hypothetical protein
MFDERDLRANAFRVCWLRKSRLTLLRLNAAIRAGIMR